MNKDYITLKDKYGEKFAKLCRKNFSTLLEKEGLLPNLILSKFAPNHSLYEDITKYGTATFVNYIYSLLNKEKQTVKTDKTVKELLNSAGYDFYECKTENDVKNFEKYYKENEKLCTFGSNRLEICDVFWAVKKDVDQIKREDYTEPERQDKYGTSVISIQFTKDNNILSIKNRYNHTVENPDATFSNNLENIIPGLTYAFEKEYGYKIKQNESNHFELPNYIRGDDGKNYKYNYEVNNIYYCMDNVIIDNGRVKKLDKSRYLLIDYFIIDLQEKNIFLYDKNIPDSFPNSISQINKIEIIKDKKEKNKTIIMKTNGNEPIEITVNKLNQIIEIKNPNIKIIEDNYLKHNQTLKSIELPNVIKIKKHFLLVNEDITNISLPKVKEIGNNFMLNCNNLENISIPNVEIIGNSFLSWNKSLKNINLPSIKQIGDEFMSWNECIETISMPNLENVGSYFLENNQALKKIDLPNLQSVKNFFMPNISEIEYLNIPNLEDQKIIKQLESKLKKTKPIKKINIIKRLFSKTKLIKKEGTIIVKDEDINEETRNNKSR